MLNVRFAIIVALAFLYGAFFATGLQSTPQLKIEGQAWCYWADFRTLDDFGYVQAPPHSLVDIHPKGVRVYEQCE